MQISKKPLNQNIHKQIETIFCQLLADTATAQEAKTLTDDILTITEKEAIMKRIAIAVFLEKGRSYQNIKQFLKVSSATIADVQGKLSNPGFQMALQKIKAEKWANDWTQKITRLVERIVPGGK